MDGLEFDLRVGLRKCGSLGKGSCSVRDLEESEGLGSMRVHGERV